MNKGCWIPFLLFCVIFPLSIFPQIIGEVSVDSEADQYASAGEAVEVSISVTHQRSAKVDQNSFRMEGTSLPVTFVKEVELSERSDLIISIYTFTIPPKKSGLNFLPPISVTVGGEKYTSNQSTFTVD